MGRRKNTGLNERDFKELDRRYRTNENGDPLVRAFNSLNADDRAIMLAYIAIGRNKSELAKLLGVSFPVMDDRIWRIQVIVAERYQKIMQETDEETQL